METKHIRAIVICALTLLVSAIAVSAQTGKTVILVSDNMADSAVAEAIKSVKNIDVVTTPWGEFNESVVAKITALNPTVVFILGGPAAVPSEYENALSSYTWFRIYGNDRYATAAAALEHFKGDFKGKGIVIAYGYDSKGIKHALEKAKKIGGIILFVKPDDVPLDVERAINSSNASEVDVEEAPDMDEDKISKQLHKTKARVKLSR